MLRYWGSLWTGMLICIPSVWACNVTDYVTRKANRRLTVTVETGVDDSGKTSKTLQCSEKRFDERTGVEIAPAVSSKTEEQLLAELADREAEVASLKAALADIQK